MPQYNAKYALHKSGRNQESVTIVTLMQKKNQNPFLVGGVFAEHDVIINKFINWAQHIGKISQVKLGEKSRYYGKRWPRTHEVIHEGNFGGMPLVGTLPLQTEMMLKEGYFFTSFRILRHNVA